MVTSFSCLLRTLLCVENLSNFYLYISPRHNGELCYAADWSGVLRRRIERFLNRLFSRLIDEKFVHDESSSALLNSSHILRILDFNRAKKKKYLLKTTSVFLDEITTNICNFSERSPSRNSLQVPCDGCFPRFAGNPLRAKRTLHQVRRYISPWPGDLSLEAVLSVAHPFATRPSPRVMHDARLHGRATTPQINCCGPQRVSLRNRVS